MPRAPRLNFRSVPSPRGLVNFIPGLGEGAGPPGGASGPGRTSDNTLSVTLFTLPRTLRLPVPWGIIPTGPKESAFECPMRIWRIQVNPEEHRNPHSSSTIRGNDDVRFRFSTIALKHELAEFLWKRNTKIALDSVKVGLRDEMGCASDSYRH